jgi:hypothetical protein
MAQLSKQNEDSMKKFLAIFAVMFALATPAMAQSGCDNIQLENLPESVVIELKKKCVDLAKPVVPVDVESMGEYAELGKKYGIALSEVAKSIGTTVNELALTPVGKFMLVMVAYKVMGNDLIGIFGGITWFATMIPIWLYLFHRLVLRNRVVQERTQRDGTVIRETLPVNLADGNVTGTILILLVVLGIICICGFFMIFG